MPLELDWGADALRAALSRRGLAVFSVIKRGKALTIVSGPEDAPDPHARMTHVGPGRWRLDLLDHRDRWESTQCVGTLDELVETLVGIGRLDPSDA